MGNIQTPIINEILKLDILQQNPTEKNNDALYIGLTSMEQMIIETDPRYYDNIAENPVELFSPKDED